MGRSKRIIIYSSLIFFIAVVTAGLAIVNLQSKISTRLEQGWILPPLELYSQGLALSVGRKISRPALEIELKNRGLVSPRDYLLDRAEGCSELSGVSFGEASFHCLWLRQSALVVGWNDQDVIQEIWVGDPPKSVTHHALFPRLITQFFEGLPILQQNTPLSEVPLYCLQAATAIEDRDFLEHGGVSATGILRAMVRNLKAGRWAEGGSTITQQLVKNFFLTAQKTLRRKIQEQILAVLLESQLSKDQILEMYLNVIYMGQSGPYQIRGFGSAALAYFDKPVSSLNLGECALLAAMINSPGRYSPFEHKETALARRSLVLDKMVEATMIDRELATPTKSQELPVAPPPNRRAHAPYFVLSALKEFEALELDAESGARLYTTLDPEVQSVITQSISKVLPTVEARIKKPGPTPLQVSVILADVSSGEVLGLTGGRDFRTTQYNRATAARRQIGSTVKPFVYLPALAESSPVSEIIDEPFEWKNGKNNWKPKNYDGKFAGSVPLFWALTQSLNIPAAKVGQQVGLAAIQEALAAAGVTSPIPELPSLTLGVLELSPMELTQAYLTLARLGQAENLHTLIRVEGTDGQVLFEHEPAQDQALDPVATSVLVGMMKQSMNVGTAKSARALGLTGPFAGKTGTTSDTKDAWFAGFNKNYLMVVWVGYDDNAVMGLTGASAALPIWVEIAKTLAPQFTEADFNWPAGVERRLYRKTDLLEKFPQLQELPDEIELIVPDWAS